MKIIYLLIIAFLSLAGNTNAQSPDWRWAKSMGGTGGDLGYSIAIDPAGSGAFFVTGSFQGTVDFDPGAGVFNLTSSGTSDLFISKFDSSGNFVWAKRIGGTTSYVQGQSIAFDPYGSGALYIIGHFNGTADFDPDSSGIFNLTSAGGQDIFISKLDSSGNLIWAKSMGGTSHEYVLSIAIDPTGSGAIYLTGLFIGTSDFDPGPGVFNLTTAGGYSDLYISKLGASGNFVWVKQIGGAYSDRGNSIALDSSSNIYTTGYFQDTVDFDPGAGVFNLTSAGNNDIFISKLDSSGNFVWAKSMGGTNSDWGNSIAYDPIGSGSVYTTGSFEGTVDFDPGAGILNLTSAGGDDIFISKLDSSGNYIWTKAVGGTGGDTYTSITVDAIRGGDIYTIGIFGDTVDMDPGVGVFNLTSAGGWDILISKSDSSGNFIWAKAVGGTNDDIGRSLALNASGNSYITGYFNSPSIPFGSSTLMNADNTGNTSDIFLARLDTAILTGNGELENFNSGILLFPNPAANHFTITSGNNSKIIEVMVTDITGKIIYTTTAAESQKMEVNTVQFAEGVYVVKIKTAEFVETKRFIVAK